MTALRILIVATLSAFSPALRAQKPCLDNLPGDAATTTFDTAFDRNSQGNSFSCDIYVTATQARDVLEDFRFGFFYDSQPHVERSVAFPLKVSVVSGEEAIRTLTLNNFSEWQRFKSDNFDEAQRTLIACSTLGNVRIYKREGGFSIGPGFVWFVLSGEDLRVRAINLARLPDEVFQRACVGG